MKNIRLTQLDGLKFPNLALMKLSHYFKSNSYNVILKKSVDRDFFEQDYNLSFASVIFFNKNSLEKINRIKLNFPNTIIGGTGSNSNETIEKYLNINKYENYDYDLYPEIDYSIGFSQRGCRLSCKFCVVPQKEGKNKNNSSIYEIWKQNPKNTKKKIILLDNDFFGQPNYEEKANEIIEGNYKISFSQGINIRLIDKKSAKLLSQMNYKDDSFKRKRIYTAWDNMKDEKIFFEGINHLLESGIKPSEIMVYFLCNYWQKGLSEDVLHRFNKMKNIGLLPYPMIFDKENADSKLKKFQEYVIQGIYRVSEFNDFIDKSKYKINKQIEECNLPLF